EHVVQRALGQLHDDDELAVNGFDAVERADERMTHLADALQSVQLLFGADAFDVEGIEVAVDEFDGFEDAAGGLALPDFAEAAASEPFDESIPGDRLGVALSYPTHERSRSTRSAPDKSCERDTRSVRRAPQPPRPSDGQ